MIRCLFLFACLFVSTACQRPVACFDYPTVVRKLGCGGRAAATRMGFEWCEVIINDGAIVRVHPDQAIVGARVCLDK